MTSKKTSRLRGDRAPGKGELIDQRYRVEEIVGRGGMGCIVRARQLTMERDVAIKLLHPHVADDEDTVRRFEREVHLAKGLAHPNIIQYYDYGKLDDGSLYLVMELLEGRDLHAHLRQDGNFRVHRTIDITLQILDGLAEAHACSVVHRDLKPRNLFLLDRSRRGDFVKILDFGIAKSTGTVQSELTRTGVVCGTPSYLAPELLITQHATPASDLYAVGLIMLEMLSGRRVFKADTMARTFFMQLRQPVPIPPRLRQTPLEEFLLYALAKHPDDRFQTAEEMMDELELVLQQMSQDFKLSPDDIESMSESVSSNALGTSGIGKMGLDVLRDPAWAITPTPIPAPDHLPEETIADVMAGQKLTAPTRQALPQESRAGQAQSRPIGAAGPPADQSARPQRQERAHRPNPAPTSPGPAQQAPSSGKVSRWFLGIGIVSALGVAIGLTLWSNFAEPDADSDAAAATTPAPDRPSQPPPFGDEGADEEMNFAVDDEPQDGSAGQKERGDEASVARNDRRDDAPSTAASADEESDKDRRGEPDPSRDPKTEPKADKPQPADKPSRGSSSKRKPPSSRPASEPAEDDTPLSIDAIMDQNTVTEDKDDDGLH